MRKLLAVAMASLMVAGMVSGSAVAGKKKKQVAQHVEGTILLPQPGGALGNCNYRPQRATMGASGEAFPNGVLGFTFNVDPKTVGQPFKLEVTGGEGDVDLDIGCYSEYGDPADPTTAPGNTGDETLGRGGAEGTKIGRAAWGEGSERRARDSGA